MIFSWGYQGYRDKNQVTKCPFGSWKCPFISSKSVSFSFCDVLIAFSPAILKHWAQVAVSISIKFLFLFFYCPLFAILSFAFIFVHMPTIILMLFDLLYFLFLLYGTQSLISILIQIVKTITMECGDLDSSIISWKTTWVT